MAAHRYLIVAIQKVPNLAAPQAGVEHSIIYYQVDGNAASTYSVVIGTYPPTMQEATDAIKKDTKARDDLVGQTFSD
jgi:hypothetical protein